MQKKIYLILGIGLALLAAVMVNVYINQQRKLAIADAKRRLETIQANQTAVLIAKEDFPVGTAVDPGKLEVKIIPSQYLQPQAVTSIDRIAGMVMAAAVSKGEQLALSKLAWPKEARGGSLATVTPVGKRAITISVDNVASLGGMIKAGDYVDVIATVSVPVQTADGKQVAQAAVIPLFQNIMVLAVGQETGGPVAEEARYKKEEKREISPFITLALAAQEANLIAFVQEQGKIRLILRSPADSQVQPTQPASWETLFQYIMPNRQIDKEAAQPKAEVEAPQGYVEIYRGLNKEKVPLSKQ